MRTKDLVKLLGVNLKVKGFYYVVSAIDLARAFPEESILITKDVCPRVASKFQTTSTGVEHAIRTAVNTAWINNKEMLDKIAGYKLFYRPSNKEFIMMTASYLNELDFLKKNSSTILNKR